jgi:DMSO reductase anchor subunit
MQSHASSVIVFNGLNFAEWNEQVQFHLGAQNLDMALLLDKSDVVTDESNKEDKAPMANWEHSNRLCLMFLRMMIDGKIKIALPDTDNVQEVLANVKARSQIADKSLASVLMAKFTTMKYDGSCTMHAHITKMTSLFVKLRSLRMTVDEGFLVQFILNSLPNDVYVENINLINIFLKFVVQSI